MKPGQRYWLIEIKATGEYLESWDGETLRFNSEEDAKYEIADICDNSNTATPNDYEIVCARW